jgi:hypothetical protein
LSSGDADMGVENNVFTELYPSSPSIVLNIYMRYILLLLLSISVIADETPYSPIIKRNAFGLTDILPPVSEILNKVETPKIKLFLTGITRWNNETNAHMYSKDLPTKYLSLQVNEQFGPIRVLNISKDAVKVVNDGHEETLSFLTNSLPSIVTGTKSKATVVKKDSRESSRSRSSRDKESKKPAAAPSANVIKVPSRRSQVDPRIIEKSLEYISKMEDNDKRDYLLKRVESLQSGQHEIKLNIDQNERRRQYDEWRKRE